MMKWGKIHKNPFPWKCSWKDGMMGQEDAASTPGARSLDTRSSGAVAMTRIARRDGDLICESSAAGLSRGMTSHACLCNSFTNM